MSMDDALARVIDVLRGECESLRSENARLREVIATYPERQTLLVKTLADLRDAVYTLTQEGPRAALGGQTRGVVDQRADVLFSGVPPAPDESWWGRTSLADDRGTAPAREQTQVEIPTDVGLEEGL